MTKVYKQKTTTPRRSNGCRDGVVEKRINYFLEEM